MAATNRKPGAGLDPSTWNLRRLLEDEPFSVEFFQAVQLLERIYPDRDPVGLFVHSIARSGALCRAQPAGLSRQRSAKHSLAVGRTAA